MLNPFSYALKTFRQDFSLSNSTQAILDPFVGSDKVSETYPTILDIVDKMSFLDNSSGTLFMNKQN